MLCTKHDLFLDSLFRYIKLLSCATAIPITKKLTRMEIQETIMKKSTLVIKIRQSMLIIMVLKTTRQYYKSTDKKEINYQNN